MGSVKLSVLGSVMESVKGLVMRSVMRFSHEFSHGVDLGAGLGVSQGVGHEVSHEFGHGVGLTCHEVSRVAQSSEILNCHFFTHFTYNCRYVGIELPGQQKIHERFLRSYCHIMLNGHP